ncbi:R3H domain-containing nucleic acid-binding protein, partial [Chloroflexota bacterium]
GVQLVGTAHGNTLENLMMNPTLADLIGGIQTVTLGDEEAKRRGTQKSILERMSPPTFSIVVEIQDRDKVAIHPDVSEAVDATLRGQPIATEIRWLDKAGEVKIEKEVPITVTKESARDRRLAMGNNLHKLYLFGINRGRLEQMAKERQLSLDIVNNLSDADLLITSRSYYRRKPQTVRDAEASNLAIYVLKSNTPPQVRQLLKDIYPEDNTDSGEHFELALGEVEKAVEQVRNGQEVVDLSPQSAYIRRLQHLIAERNDLASHSLGQGHNRRVRIYKEEQPNRKTLRKRMPKAY